VRAWIRLIKFRYHVTFITVICGTLLLAPQINDRLLLQLALLYFAFNVLLYGGIYTLNDVADRDADGRHPGKRSRPIASGAVSVRAASVFALCLIAAGLTVAFVAFPPGVLACFLAAVAANACYSLGARNHRYLDIVFNAVTHPNRFLMGALLVDRVPPATHLVTLMLLAVALSCLRREVERDADGWQARTTIAQYGPTELARMSTGCLALLAVCGVLYGPAAPGFYVIVGSTALVTVVGGWMECPVRAGLRTIWTQ
jgi:decaprenyl-phosphate phosphoribosyltransferase